MILKKIYTKILNNIRLAFLRNSYNFKKIEAKQHNIYKKIGYDREAAKKVLDSLYINHPNTRVLVSEHHLLFAAESLLNNTNSILEIGTYTGSCTKLLSVLFPTSKITTYDLPDDDSIFTETYERSDKEKRSIFINKRNALLGSCENVDFIQKNSLALQFNSKNKKFDLIWVDGAHGYPVVAMDIMNSLACLSYRGSMFIDDVWTKRSSNDPNYRSIGAYESILALQHSRLINFELIPKRIEFPHGEGFMKKYIARITHSEYSKNNFL